MGPPGLVGPVGDKGQQVKRIGKFVGKNNWKKFGCKLVMFNRLFSQKTNQISTIIDKFGSVLLTSIYIKSL